MPKPYAGTNVESVVKRAGSLLLSLCFVSVSSAGAAGQAALVEIDSIDTGELEVLGFELDEDQDVRVIATDLEARKHFGELTTAWILETGTRRVVWTMGDAEPVRKHDGFRDYDEALFLKAGVYEAYYATYADEYELNEDEGWWRSAGRAVRRFTERKIFGREDYEDAVDELKLIVRGRGKALDEDDLERHHERMRQEALVALAPLGDDEDEERAFVLEKPVEIEIYAVGEVSHGEGYDYGWIVDTKRRRKVWTFDQDNSRRAGGSVKNRTVRQSLRLAPGRYAVFFVTDGSHSAEEWNALPPRDPAFWGLTLWIKEGAGKLHARTVDYRDLPDEQLVVEAARLGNGAHESRGITLTEAMDVRVYAIGEGFKGGMADYGWILDARTRERIWTMDYERTLRAGGSEKNRLADEILRLEAGSYLVVFVTDGSHAYPDWNAKPPRHQERWGITLFAASEDFDPSTVRAYEEQEDESILARITQAESGCHEKRRFSLDVETRIAVFALGEGLGGKMSDYGWIEETGSGEVIWKMTYPVTEKAGGAAKNRAFHGTLTLEAGEYTLHYRTDDSHAFGDWNSSPPHDPEAWGIQVARVD